MGQDRKSVSSDPFGDQGGDTISQHTGDDPAEVFGIANDEVTDDSQLHRVRLILESSRAFSEAVAALKRKGVNVIVSFEDLPPDAGGGRTYGSAGDRERRIVLDHADMKPGIHVIDVYAHEFGHVWEDHGGPTADYFMNLVQEDLGIRTTRPTHTVLRSARNPFAPAGSRENPVFDRGTSPYEKGVSRDPFAQPEWATAEFSSVLMARFQFSIGRALRGPLTWSMRWPTVPSLSNCFARRFWSWLEQMSPKQPIWTR